MLERKKRKISAGRNDLANDGKSQIHFEDRIPLHLF